MRKSKREKINLCRKNIFMSDFNAVFLIKTLLEDNET